MKLFFYDGEILWERELGGAQNQDDRGWAVAVGSDDHPIITGVTTNTDGTANYFTAKLHASDGSVIWSRSLPGAVNNLAERAGWIAVCENGDAVMANRTWTSTTSYDVVLHRYASADGGTVWTRQYGSGPNRSDNPRQMVMDPSGDLLVCGVVAGDYMAVRFDCDTGAPVWNAAYNGPGNGYDTGNGLAFGPNGEVIVTGFATGTNTGWDCATVAFDWGSGNRLWSLIYDAGDAQTDEGSVMAVGPSGTLYVVGYGYRLDSDADILSIRYQVAPAAGVEERPDDRGQLAAAPNPFRSEIRLRFDSLRPGPARVIVADATGRIVRTLLDGAVAAGEHRLDWDGRDASGGRAVAGVYWIRLEAAGSSRSSKILLLPE